MNLISELKRRNVICMSWPYLVGEWHSAAKGKVTLTRMTEFVR